MPDLTGKSIAVVLVPPPSDESDDAYMFTGYMIQQNDRYLIDRGENHPPFELMDEWLPLIQPMDPDLALELENAELCMVLNLDEPD